MENAQAAPVLQPQQQQPKQMDTRYFFSELKRSRVPSFEGGPDPDKADKWLDEVENCFELLQVPEKVKTQIIRPFLIGEAQSMAETNVQPLATPVAWERFIDDFRKFYILASVTIRKINEFESLKQEARVTVSEYANRFTL